MQQLFDKCFVERTQTTSSSNTDEQLSQDTTPPQQHSVSLTELAMMLLRRSEKQDFSDINLDEDYTPNIAEFTVLPPPNSKYR